MVFVADDLSAWLVSLLADAGRMKLTALLLGDEQQRALRQAATSAVLAVVSKLDPSGGHRASQLAMVINEVFQTPDSGSHTEAATILESLREGVAAQLAVLGDASLTGTGLSSAEVLGVDVQALAGALADELIQEIKARGARGGVLAPLADQINHDRTHMQGDRLEGMLTGLAQAVSYALARTDGAAPTQSGRLPGQEDLLRESPPQVAPGQTLGLRTERQDEASIVSTTNPGRCSASNMGDLQLRTASDSPSLMNVWSDLQADVRLHDVAAFLHEACREIGFQRPGSELGAGTRPIIRSAGAVQQAIARAVISGGQGIAIPPSMLAVSKSIVEHVVGADPGLMRLRYDLAELNARMGDFGGALTEINEIVRGPDPPTAQCVNLAGEMLINAGSITFATQAFEIVSRALTDSGGESSLIVSPLSEDERIYEWLRSEQFLKIWLADYRGHTEQGMKAARRLLPQARELGGDILETILHRLARSQCELGAERHDVAMVEAGIRINRAARAVVPDMDKPLSYLLDYSAMSEMRLPGTERSWKIAKEHVEGRPDAVRAHLLFASGKRLRAYAPIAAIGELENALEIWAGHPYASGVCDALVELGLAHGQLGTRVMIKQALEYFGAARLICERFAFARHEHVQRYIDACASRLGIADGEVRLLAQECLDRWPLVYEVHDLSRSDFHALRSFVKADAKAVRLDTSSRI